ncbi:substrate-binding domain-containing protein [Hydrogenibacillus schlegelii]|uniref:ABC-type tungstate transport system, periplasmic binding protein n=2 Tax=Hydrogenibacillus schlegelii TaxID=1484 RepID=A0A132N6J8_HYDSH|nr:substrate-binding domain-containing protein [Hydrogenibacillus schlegelii]KWX05617.1 tungsten ABC transporter substrate-binding protein [Hydrogenibacillus schlegelii]OAR05514.1 tungsten ABC transporter substrate-binding protein [Hydrogenibacillus schlegelii]PTQ54043.1 MAG: ABC-type tungstate transport system, periplasmic binding protein [Hydrogenibacillus schlegelii]
MFLAQRLFRRRGRAFRHTAGVALLALFMGLSGCGARPDQGADATAGTTGAPEEAKPDALAAGVTDVILATTTSTQDSGLLDVLIPRFEQSAPYRVKTVAVGTGQALKMGEQGEADVLLTHAPEAEKPLVEAGVVTNYHRVMYNDFILVGPPDDPAGVGRADDLAAAFRAIAGGKTPFVSRGDDSGTHKKELALWKGAGIDPHGADWYIESGTGMGQTLLIASEKGAYTLTDRGTYLAYRDKLHLAVVREKDPELLNVYHVMQVNPERFPQVNAKGAAAFVQFLIAPETQALIGDFGKDRFGEPLFFPDAD